MSAPSPSMYSAAAREMAERLSLSFGPANLEVFADALADAATENPRVVALVSDSRGSGKLGPFGQKSPERLIEVGIAEQNLVGVAAGLAASGAKPFAVSPACFLTARALEQIKNDVCYSDVPVVLVGISAGVSYGALGSTHHSLHDFAALRAIHNIAVVAPADHFEAAAAVKAAAKAPHPVYLRFGKAPLLEVHRTAPDFQFGRSFEVRSGTDIALVGTGETVGHLLLAAGRLAEWGIEARVLSVPTVKPLDQESIRRAGIVCGAVLVAEEHSEHGGLGDACAAVLMKSGVPCRFDVVAIPDEDTVTGSQADIFGHYGISMEGISERASQLLQSGQGGER